MYGGLSYSLGVVHFLHCISSSTARGERIDCYWGEYYYCTTRLRNLVLSTDSRMKTYILHIRKTCGSSSSPRLPLDTTSPLCMISRKGTNKKPLRGKKEYYEAY